MEKTFGVREVFNGVLQLGISRVRGRWHTRGHAALSLGGIPCVWGRLVQLHPHCGILCVCGKNPRKLALSPNPKVVSPACGKNHSTDAVCFPVTKVPVSTTVAPHSRVLCSLHGRMSSGPPQPYFAEILRRGDNTAVREGDRCGRGLWTPPSSEKESPIPAYSGDGTVCTV